MAEFSKKLGTVEHDPKMVGKKQYGPAGSHTATSGPLPTDGYLQRSRNKKKRSAVAAAIDNLAAKKAPAKPSFLPGSFGGN